MKNSQETFPLHTIKKVATIEEDTELVNALLARGWVLLSIRTDSCREPSGTYSSSFYTLGHTDQSAEVKSVEAEIRPDKDEMEGMTVE